MRVARVRSEAVSSRTIGFALGPRLNAIGRMDDARLALELLMTRDRPEADALAQSLEDAERIFRERVLSKLRPEPRATSGDNRELRAEI